MDFCFRIKINLKENFTNKSTNKMACCYEQAWCLALKTSRKKCVEYKGWSLQVHVDVVKVLMACSLFNTNFADFLRAKKK